MVQPKEQGTLHFTPGTEDATGRVTAANSFKNSPFSFKEEKKRLPLSLQLSHRLPCPKPQHHSHRVLDHSLAVPKGGPQAGKSGAEEGGFPCLESFPGDSQIRRFLCLPLPLGRLG